MKAEAFMEASVTYWNGFFEGWIDELSTGALIAVYEETFENPEIINDCCEMLDLEEPEGDGNDLMHAYLRVLEDTRNAPTV